MDREDWLYFAATALIGFGTGMYSLPAGAIAVGSMLAIPPLLSLFRTNRKGPDK